jgi:hypothetical protein
LMILMYLISYLKWSPFGVYMETIIASPVMILSISANDGAQLIKGLGDDSFYLSK